MDDVFLYVFIDSTIPFKIFPTDAKGYCALVLPLQHFYTIKISKPGYVSKIITADTHVPKKEAEGNYLFEFTSILFETISDLDVSILKFPIAKVFFNTFTKKFDYDYNYTVKINNDIKNMYNDYYLLKKKMKSSKNNSNGKTDTTAKIRTTTDTVKKSSIVNSSTAIIHVPTITQKKIVFSIQIFASSEQQQKNSVKFRGLLNVKELHEGEIYKYYVEEYSNHNDAIKRLKNIKIYFPDAFIIAFVDGIKTSEKEASDLMNK